MRISNFFLHCKICYRYFEMKLFPSSTSTESIALLDHWHLEIILSKLNFAGSTSIVLYEALLLLLEEKRKLTKKIPECVTTTTQPDGCICLICCFSHTSIYFSCHMKVVHVVCQREKPNSISVIPFSFPSMLSPSVNTLTCQYSTTLYLKKDLCTLPYCSLIHSLIH